MNLLEDELTGLIGFIGFDSIVTHDAVLHQELGENVVNNPLLRNLVLGRLGQSKVRLEAVEERGLRQRQIGLPVGLGKLGDGDIN